jgi:signal transduction histidine kinase
MSKGTIVCVDDEKLVLISLRDQLFRLLGDTYEILLAESGEEALEIFAELQQEGVEIPLVLCDQLMPNMEGHELLIRLHAQYPKTLKILLTGQAEVGAVIQAVNHAKLYRYIAKPWDETDLGLTVRAALRSYFQDKQLVEQNLALQAANQELERLNLSLEHKVAERTVKLIEANRNLRQAKTMAEAANHAKSLFLAGMSHELRTPLTAILGFTELLRFSPALGLEEQENLSIIYRCGEHLLKLIMNVLEMSKIEVGSATLKQNSFDLDRLLAHLEEILWMKAAEKGLTLIFDRSPNLPQFITTDESKLQQVLLHLLGNAIKFTQKGRVVLRVRKEPQKSAPDQPQAACALQFEVEDTGSGIPANAMEYLFEAFEPTALEQEELPEGLGLGLALSREFVSLMGGDITVHSAVGQGSVFKVNLPVEIPDVNDLLCESQALHILGLAPGQPAYRLLIADDTWEHSILLVKLLLQMGFEVQEARNGQAAIALWEQWHPHLIFMDMRMPVMNGYEATQRIKATAKGQATAIIAIIGSAFEVDRSTILSIGCDDFVRKPFQQETVLAKLAQHLGVRYVYETGQESV